MPSYYAGSVMNCGNDDLCTFPKNLPSLMPTWDNCHFKLVDPNAYFIPAAGLGLKGLFLLLIGLRTRRRCYLAN